MEKALIKIKLDILTFIDICKIIYWKLTNEKILVINEAGGLGDYLWVRNFPKLIKQQTSYKIIVCVTSRWLDFTKKLDSESVDVFIGVKNPVKPRIKLIFKLFKFDLFIDAIGNYPVDKQIHCKDYIYHHITDKYSFAMFRQQDLFKKIVTISSEFRYSLPTIKPKTKMWWKNENYGVLVLGGFTEGEFSNQQIESIFKKLIEHKIYVVIIGFKNQKNKINLIINKFDSSKYLINTCGMFKNYELPYVINKSKFVITPNTGVYQIALLLNKKTILIEKKVNNSAAKYDIPLNVYINPKENLKKLSDVSMKEISEGIDMMMGSMNQVDIDWQSLNIK